MLRTYTPSFAPISPNVFVLVHLQGAGMVPAERPHPVFCFPLVLIGV